VVRPFQLAGPQGLPQTTQKGAFDLVRTPLSTAMATAFAEESEQFNPLVALGRLFEAQRRREGIESFQVSPYDEMGLMEPVPAPETEDPVLSVEEANARSKGLGLEFEKPERTGFVDLLIRRKKEELKKRNKLDRVDTNIFGHGAIFLARLAASAKDPLNIASAFVPVLREARFLSFVSRFGVTRARAARGAIEGAVGAALVEPIVLASTSLEQADYGFASSVLNITIGSLLGSGLHVVGGAAFGKKRAQLIEEARISSQGSRARPETREDLVRASVAQFSQDEQVDIASIAALDKSFDEFVFARGQNNAFPIPDLDTAGRAAFAGHFGTPVIVAPNVRMPPQIQKMTRELSKMTIGDGGLFTTNPRMGSADAKQLAVMLHELGIKGRAWSDRIRAGVETRTVLFDDHPDIVVKIKKPKKERRGPIAGEFFNRPDFMPDKLFQGRTNKFIFVVEQRIDKKGMPQGKFRQLRRFLGKQGFLLEDANANHNVGLMPDGRPVVFDDGSVIGFQQIKKMADSKRQKRRLDEIKREAALFDAQATAVKDEWNAKLADRFKPPEDLNAPLGSDQARGLLKDAQDQFDEMFEQLELADADVASGVRHAMSDLIKLDELVEATQVNAVQFRKYARCLAGRLSELAVT